MPNFVTNQFSSRQFTYQIQRAMTMHKRQYLSTIYRNFSTSQNLLSTHYLLVIYSHYKYRTPLGQPWIITAITTLFRRFDTLQIFSAFVKKETSLAISIEPLQKMTLPEKERDLLRRIKLLLFRAVFLSLFMYPLPYSKYTLK